MPASSTELTGLRDLLNKLAKMLTLSKQVRLGISSEGLSSMISGLVPRNFPKMFFGGCYLPRLVESIKGYGVWFSREGSIVVYAIQVVFILLNDFDDRWSDGLD